MKPYGFQTKDSKRSHRSNVNPTRLSTTARFVFNFEAAITELRMTELGTNLIRRQDENSDSNDSMQVVVRCPVSMKHGWELEEMDRSAQNNLDQIEH